MGEGAVATHKKKARRMNAWLVFIDESGLLMAPLLRRSWAPCGQTPVLRQRTRSHRKVSAIAAVCVSPARDRVRLVFRLHPDENITAARIGEFLGQVHRHLQGPVLLVWDRLAGHRARKVQSVIKAIPNFHVEYLPAYAPELNPVEQVWSHLKTNALANYAPTELDALTRKARKAARAIQNRDALLRAFIEHTPLSLRLA